MYFLNPKRVKLPLQKKANFSIKKLISRTGDNVSLNGSGELLPELLGLLATEVFVHELHHGGEHHQRYPPERLSVRHPQGVFLKREFVHFQFFGLDEICLLRKLLQEALVEGVNGGLRVRTVAKFLEKIVEASPAVIVHLVGVREEICALFQGQIDIVGDEGWVPIQVVNKVVFGHLADMLEPGLRQLGPHLLVELALASLDVIFTKIQFSSREANLAGVLVARADGSCHEQQVKGGARAQLVKHFVFLYDR